MKARLVITSSIEPKVEESNNLFYKKLVSAEQDGEGLSVTYVEIEGEHRALKTDASTRVYYILSGDFVFTIDTAETISASAGDCVVIYPSSVYGFVGNGQYLVMNGPAFQEGDDIYV